MGFAMFGTRTGRAAPSDIKKAIEEGKLSPCPYMHMDGSMTDHVLTGFLYRGTDVEDKRPRCMNVLAFGYGVEGMPMAKFETITETGSQIHTAPVCTYCQDLGWCPHWGQKYLQDLLEDDPEWNAADLEDDDDG